MIPIERISDTSNQAVLIFLVILATIFISVILISLIINKKSKIIKTIGIITLIALILGVALGIPHLNRTAKREVLTNGISLQKLDDASGTRIRKSSIVALKPDPDSNTYNEFSLDKDSIKITDSDVVIKNVIYTRHGTQYTNGVISFQNGKVGFYADHDGKMVLLTNDNNKDNTQ
jgi:hypothetical protein